MIWIDHISFEFVAADEPFVYKLYADWDHFCRTCFEKVVEECLSSYNKDKILHEIAQLDLDLGSIPEEDFYQEFPRRLREELLKALPLFNMSTERREEKIKSSRLANLLFYLEYGYLKEEWTDSDFNLSEELTWAVTQAEQNTDKIVKLCMVKEHVLRRLLWQTNDEAPLLKIYTAVFSEPASGLYEKRYFLGILLEAKPNVPVRFIREAAGDEKLNEMAELLDSLSVRRIMEIETEEHAEVNLSPYWHYLYEWLIRYYPFNGLAIFGGKDDFTRHLHRRLLTFIRKRNNSFYLSKSELTLSFLLEVFGTTYCIEVLNAIYDLQPHHADGSPVYDHYFNQELYQMFLRLSLLKLPTIAEEKDDAISGKKVISYPMDMAALTTFLKDVRKSNADKQMLLKMMAKERPEILTRWLQSEGLEENAFVSFIAEVNDTTLINYLLVSVSFTIMEILEQAVAYLYSHRSEISWLNGVPESRLGFAIRKAVLLWIGNGYSDQSASECIRQLLRLVYQELAGGSNEDAVERVLTELHVPEKDRKQGTGKSKIKTDIAKLQKTLDDRNLPEAVKRRLMTSFLEQPAGNYGDSILLLYEQGLLEHTLTLISQPILEEIIRQLVVQMSGTYQVTELFSLICWLINHESTVASYLQDKTSGLKIRVLVGLAKAVRSQAYIGRPITEILHFLLLPLVDKKNISFVIHLMSQEAVNDTELREVDYNELEAWIQQSENESIHIQVLLKHRWNTDKEFTGWLEDTTVSLETKRELLQKMILEKPQEWVNLLRKQPKESKVVMLITPHLPAFRLLQSMTQVDSRQAAVLSRTMEGLQRKAGRFTSLIGTNMLLSTALSNALLLFMQDRDTLGGRTLTEEEVINKFLSYLYLVCTGKPDFQNNVEWTDLHGEIITESESHKNTNDIVLGRYILSNLNKQPEKLLAWLEKDADPALIKRIADASDITLLRQWTVFLSTVTGFEYLEAFKRLMEWLIRLATNQALISEIVGALLSWIKETDWRKQTLKQMEEYFISRLFGKDLIRLPIEWISSTTLPESIRKRLLCSHTRFQPKELLGYIQQSVQQNTLSLEKWLEWLDMEDWMRLAAGLSLSRMVLWRQVMDYLSENNWVKEADLCVALATSLIKSPQVNLIYNNKEDVIRSFVESLPVLQEKKKMETDPILQRVKEFLAKREAEYNAQLEEPKEIPKVYPIPNAGLCLLAPWLPRLLYMLGYLSEDRRSFKDTDFQVRAIFLLQYLTCSTEKEYEETELAFNRLLVGLPMHVPLPKKIELSTQEKETAHQMLEGVKANWSKMRGTSIKGFQESFILRSGRLEQQDEKWLLTVDDRGYDMLLESLPWSFRLIRLPWLEKYIQVIWHENQRF